MKNCSIRSMGKTVQHISFPIRIPGEQRRQRLLRSQRHNFRLNRLAMRCKIILLVFLFQSTAVFSAEENATFSRSLYFTTLENKQLNGYVVKRFYSPSLLSCGQRCMRNAWCTSTNYKMSSKKDVEGTCELNKHDIFGFISENTYFSDNQRSTVQL